MATDARAQEKCDRISTRRPNLWSRRTSAAARDCWRASCFAFSTDLKPGWCVRGYAQARASRGRIVYLNSSAGTVITREIQTVQIARCPLLLLFGSRGRQCGILFSNKIQNCSLSLTSVLPPCRLQARLYNLRSMQSSKKNRLLGEEQSSWTVIERSTAIEQGNFPSF